MKNKFFAMAAGALMCTMITACVNLNDVVVGNPDISKAADGTRRGQAKVGPVDVVVDVTVKGGVITNIDLVKHVNGMGKKAEAVIPEVMKAQSLAVDTVSGATASSKAILKAIEQAIGEPVAAPAAPAPAFADIAGKEWKLAEIRTAAGVTAIDRDELAAEGFTNVFTLTFNAADNRISGVGAPNRFTAPYTSGEGQSLAVKPVAGTLMAPLKNPKVLTEQEYFTYLQNVNRWNLSDGTLELSTKDKGDAGAVLIFK